MSVPTVDQRPVTFASLLAVCFGALGVALVATSGAQTRAIALVAGGVLTVRASRTRPGPVLATAGTLGGAVLVLAGFWTAATASLGRIGLSELFPGLAGLVVLGLALLPVRRGWETALSTAGVALVLASVALSGITRDTRLLAILLATAAAVTAWDAARHAITLGRQVGCDADTRDVQLAHVGGTAVVGSLTVLLAAFVWRVRVTNVPLGGLVLLLVAAVAFLVVLYE